MEAAELRTRCLRLARELGVPVRWCIGSGACFNGRSVWARRPGRWYDQHTFLHDLCHHQVADPGRRGIPNWGLGADPAGDDRGPAPIATDYRLVESGESEASLLTALWLSTWGDRGDAREVWRDHQWEGEGREALRVARRLRERGLLRGRRVRAVLGALDIHQEGERDALSLLRGDSDE